MTETATRSPEWADVGYAARRLGYGRKAILQLITDGILPVMALAGEERTSHRIPMRFVEDARAAVFSGGQVELREFARQWAAA